MHNNFFFALAWSYTLEKPQYQVDVFTPLCKIGFFGKPGYDFPTRVLVTKQLIIDEGFDGLPKAGNYEYLLRGLGEL